MIVSLLCRATRALLSIPAVLLRRDTAIEAELLVLRHENAVQRRQLNGLIRYEPADRFWLAALSSLLPRHHWRRVFRVTPGTRVLRGSISCCPLSFEDSTRSCEQHVLCPCR